MIVVNTKEWLQLVDMRGFSRHRISAKVVNIDGTPQVTSLHIDLGDGQHPVALTGTQLRSLNLRAIARAPMVITSAELHADLRDTMRQMSTKKPAKGRRVVTVKQVAEIWKLAYDAGIRAPRGQVVMELGITERTASRYIKMAREAGLIPEEWR